MCRHNKVFKVFNYGMGAQLRQCIFKVRLINVLSRMFTAPFSFLGPNISLPLTLCVYFWIMPAVPNHKMVRLSGPSHQSLSSFHILSTLVLLLYYFFPYFCSLISSNFMFHLSSFICARIPNTPIPSSASRSYTYCEGILGCAAALTSVRGPTVTWAGTDLA